MTQELVSKLDQMSLNAESSKSSAAKIANLLDVLLDEYGSNDGFGSERECDPRGDFRNGEFSVFAPENYEGENTVAGCVSFIIGKIKSVIDEDEYFAEFLTEALDEEEF